MEETEDLSFALGISLRLGGLSRIIVTLNFRQSMYLLLAIVVLCRFTSEKIRCVYLDKSKHLTRMCKATVDARCIYFIQLLYNSSLLLYILCYYIVCLGKSNPNPTSLSIPRIIHAR